MQGTRDTGRMKNSLDQAATASIRSKWFGGTVLAGQLRAWCVGSCEVPSSLYVHHGVAPPEKAF
eukprot:6102886-Pleurochrysis_carterae.AAC.4